MTNIVETVICPKCEKVLRPPFRACEYEHLVCPNCLQHQNIKTGSITDAMECSGRAFSMPILNKLFINMLDTCQYGCDFKGNLLELEKHEKSCFRHDKLVGCAIKYCSWVNVMSKLINHVEHRHPEQMMALSDKDKEIIIELENPILFIIQFQKNYNDNEVYWLRVLESDKDRYMMMMHEGRTRPDIDDEDRTVYKYTISSFTNEDILAKAKVFYNTGELEEHITNDKFVIQNGTRITPLGGDKYIIKVNKRSKVPMLESLLSVACCVCTEKVVLNHDCEPNCETRKWKMHGDTRVALVALKNIAAGTEFSFNFNSKCTSVKKDCKCGAPMCPGYSGKEIITEKLPVVQDRQIILKRKYRRRNRYDDILFKRTRKSIRGRETPGELKVFLTPLEADIEELQKKRKRPKRSLTLRSFCRESEQDYESEEKVIEAVEEESAKQSETIQRPKPGPKCETIQRPKPGPKSKMVERSKSGPKSKMMERPKPGPKFKMMERAQAEQKSKMMERPKPGPKSKILHRGILVPKSNVVMLRKKSLRKSNGRLNSPKPEINIAPKLKQIGQMLKLDSYPQDSDSSLDAPLQILKTRGARTKVITAATPGTAEKSPNISDSSMDVLKNRAAGRSRGTLTKAAVTTEPPVEYLKESHPSAQNSVQDHSRKSNSGRPRKSIPNIAVQLNPDNSLKRKYSQIDMNNIPKRGRPKMTKPPIEIVPQPSVIEAQPESCWVDTATAIPDIPIVNPPVPQSDPLSINTVIDIKRDLHILEISLPPPPLNNEDTEDDIRAIHIKAEDID